MIIGVSGGLQNGLGLDCKSVHAGSIPARASNNFNGLCGDSAPFPLCAALRVRHGYPRGATSRHARRPDWPRNTAVMARAIRGTQAHSNEAQAVRCVGTGPFVLGGLRLGPMRPMPLPWGVPNLPLPGRRSRSSTAPATTTTTTEPALDGAPETRPAMHHRCLLCPPNRTSETAGSGPESSSTAMFATLSVTASGHPETLG